jgi:hypothetical protein
MTYRGVYRDGLVILEGDVNLRNGDHVDVNLRGSSGSARAGRAKSRKQVSKARVGKGRAQPVHPLIALAGIWKDRPEWKGKSSVEVVAELRKSGAPPARPARRAPRARKARG